MTRTITLLTLQEWAEFIGLSPFYIYQLGINVPTNSNYEGACEYVMFQNPYSQNNHLSREDVLQAISQAEDLFTDLTNYAPAPKFIVNEQSPYPQYYNRSKISGWGTGAGNFKSVQLRYGYVQSMGTEVLTELPQVVTIVFSDPDGDGIDERFTITATVPSGTLAGEIKLYNTAADRADEPMAEYEIKPLQISVSGVTATIIGGSWLLVKPMLQNEIAPESLDVTDPATYVDDLDIYRLTINTDEQGALIYPAYCPDDTDCGEEQVDVCYINRNATMGVVAPRWLDYCAWDNRYYSPMRFKANYYAGYPRESTGRMNRKISRIIALLATALLPNLACGCQRAQQRLFYYRELPVNEQGQLTMGQGMIDAAGAAFGITGRGAVEAYMLAQRLIQYQGTTTP